jgi:photosystem II stability/assembly factor-like uncharacterized protein
MQRNTLLFVAVMVSLFLSGVVGMAQTWRVGMSPTYPETSFNDVFFINATTGWIVGSKGPAASTYNAIVMKSTDGGSNWTTTKIDSPRSAQTVFFLDQNRGYVGGTNRRFYKSTNGGAAWTGSVVTSIPDTAATVRAIYFADTLRGWLLASLSTTYGRILHTTDGGSTWNLDTTMAARALLDMSFAKANRGVVVGSNIGALWATTNGTSWTNAPAPTVLPTGTTYTRSDVRAVAMVDSLKGYAVGWGSSASGLQPSIHLKTTDGGATWAFLPQDPLNTSYDNLYSIWFRDTSNGVAVGGGTRTAVVELTTNGGKTWRPMSFPGGFSLSSVTGVGSEMLAVGSDGVLLRSHSSGGYWECFTDIPSGTMNTLQFVSPTVGFGAGFDGVFVRTTDAGKTWHGSFVGANGISPNVQDIFFTSATTGYAAGSYRAVFKTTDGGLNWSMVLPDTTSATVYSYGVYFTDVNNGVVVGALSSTNSVIHRTTDGGTTWKTTAGTVAKQLRDVGFGSATNGAAVGMAKTGAYTTDGGATWTASTFSGIPTARIGNHKCIRFLSAATAIAVGDTVISKTTDGGVTWNYVTNPAKTSLSSVDFASPTTGYAVGVGEVLKTTDGGTTWINVTDSTVVKGTLSSVGVDKSGNPWVGGSGGVIYTTAPLVAVNPHPGLPVEFSLDQNYPNPFNPGTVISFALPQSARVEIKVYDLLGRLVATLLDGETLAAGEHQRHFDGSHLASGVYLYTVKAGDVMRTRQMLLLK